MHACALVYMLLMQWGWGGLGQAGNNKPADRQGTRLAHALLGQWCNVGRLGCGQRCG